MAPGSSGEPGSDQNRRDGRGWLSSIDLLPDEAEPDVVWALAQLRERKLPQIVILTEFNERLADRGIAPITKSAWSRFAVRKAVRFRQMDEVQKISGELVASLGTDSADQVTVMLAEMIKVSVFQRLEEDGVSTKQIMELSRALQTAVNAQRASAEGRRKLQEEFNERMRQAADAVAKAGTKGGISDETLAEINRALGVG